MTPGTADFDNSDILPYLDNLKSHGILLNETEVWIVMACSKEYLSISQMSRRRNMSYQGIHSYISKLVSLRYLEATNLGREKYYKATIDLRDFMEDKAIRIESHGQYLTFEEAFWFLEFERHKTFDRAFKYCLGQLYYRAFVLSNENVPQAPTSDQVLSTMKVLIREAERELDMLRSLANLPLSSEDPKQLQRIRAEFKSEKTHDKLMQAAGSLRNLFENKRLKTTGFSEEVMAPPKIVAEVMREQAETE